MCVVFLRLQSVIIEDQSGVQTPHWRRVSMDISGSTSELIERWRVWMRGFTYFAEGKANLQNPARKRSKLLYRAGSGVQDNFDNLTIASMEGQADDVYQQTVCELSPERILSHARKCSVQKVRSSPTTSRTQGRCGLVRASTKETSKTLWI